MITPTHIAAVAVLATLGLATLGLAACDRSAQPADGATGKNEVGTAANTPSGQVVPTTGTNAERLDAPEVTVTPGEPAASGEPANR